MATAVGTGFDISKLLDSITQADESLSKLMSKSNATSRSIITAFQQISSQGVVPYTQSLEKNLALYNSIRDAITTSTGRARKNFGDMKAEIDKVISSSELLLQSLYKTSEFKGNLGMSIGTMRETLAMQARVNERTQIGAWTTSAEDVLGTNEQRIQSARRYRDEMQRVYTELFDVAIKREDDIRNYEKVKWEESIRQYRENKEAKKKEDEKYHNQRQKELEETFKRESAREAQEHKRKIDNINKRFDLIAKRDKREAQEREAYSRQNAKNQQDYLNSPKGALEYARGLDTGVKSINTMNQALQQLRNAQANVDQNTAKGRKEFQDLGNEISKVEKEMKKYKRSTDDVQNKHNGIINTGAQLRRVLTRIFSVYAIKGYIQKLADVRGEFELQQRSLQAIVQNVDKANKLWDKTVALAVKSPFRVKDLVTYTKQLAAYQVETEKLYDTTKMLADVSAGLGVDMNRLILAYGQVKSANFLRGTELRQFTEAGIPMLNELAKYYSELEKRAVSAADVFARISKRGVAFEDVDAVFKKLTGEGGIFYKMQEKQSETLKGMISNLRDSIDLMLNDIGKSQDGALKGIISATKDIIENWRVVATVMKQVGYAVAINALKNLVVGWKAVKLATFEGTAAMYGAEKAGAALRLGLNKLFATMKANPFIFALGAVAALTHAWVNHMKAVKAANEKYDEMSKREVKRMDDLKDVKKEIEENNAAIKDSNKTQDEQNAAIEKNRSILERLKDEYPDLYNSIKQQADGTIELNNAIEEQNEKLRANIVLQQQAKAGKFHQDLGKNYQDALDAQSALTSKLYDIRGAAMQLQTELEAKYKQGEVSDEDYNVLIDWINRVKDADTTEEQSKLWDEFFSTSDGKEAWGANESLKMKFGKFTENVKLYDDAIREMSKASLKYNNSLKDLSNNLDKQMSTYLVEMTNMTAEEGEDISKKRGAWLKEQLETLGFIDEQLQDWAKDYIKTEIKLDIKWPDPKEEKKKLQNWQRSYNNLFGDNEDTVEVERTFGGFTKIQNINTTRESVIERLQNEYKETKELMAKIEALGVENATKVGAAYEGVDFSELKANMKDIEKQLDWFGAPYEKKQKKSIEILNKRISLIKEMYKKYMELRNEQGHETAYEEVFNAYKDTFEEAFEGTGIDFTKVVVNMDKVNSLVSESEAAGEQVGTAFSDAMLEKMKEFKEAGVYIRNFSDALMPFTQKWEGFVPYAYYDQDEWVNGKPIKASESKTKKGTLTIGTGITNNSGIGYKFDENTTITEAKNQELLSKIYEQKAKNLNIILDKNKELILTQEQYNMLLDQFYQGEAGTSKAISIAQGDWEGFEKYLKTIKEYKQLNKKHVIVDIDAIKEEWDALDTLEEKLALAMKWTNITTTQTKKVNGENVTERYISSAMQERSIARSQQFTGDIQAVKLLREAAIDVSQIDFTNIEGVIEALKQLEDLARKEGHEAEVALSRAISEFEAELNLQVNVDEREGIERQIDAMFGNYEVSLEMEKLHIDPEMAKRIFNFDSVNLNEIRGKILEAFKFSQFEGLSNEAIFNLQEFKDLALERQKILKEALKKEEELQNEYLEKNAKDFIRFLKKDGDEIANAYRESGIQLGIADSFFREGKISAEVYGDAVKRIVKETNESVGKLRLENLKKSPKYIEAMGPVYNKTRKEIQKLIDEMNDLAEANKESMSPEEAEEYAKVISKLRKDQKDKKPIFFDENIQKIKDYLSLEKDLSAEKEKQAQLEEQKASQEGQLQNLQSQLDMLQQNPEGEGNAEKIQSTMSAIKGMNGQLASTNSQLTQTAGNIQGMEGAMEGIAGGAGGAIMMVDAIIKAVYQSLKAVKKMFEDIKELADSYGVDTENKVWGKWASSMETIDNVNEEVMQGWENFKSGNILGATANTIASFTKLISGINKTLDVGFENDIEEQAKKIEKLEEKYEDLERAVDNAYTSEAFTAAQRAMEQNIKAQMDAIEAQKAAEEAKKNTDKEALEDYDKQLKELRLQEEDLKKEFIENVGGSYDFAGVAEEFLDAWLDAFEETGDGLSGLDKSFDEFWKGILKKQVVLGGASKIMETYMSDINKALEDGKLSDDDINKLEQKEEDTKKRLDEFYKWANGKYDLSTNEEGELSGLAAGISGITEEQADVLAGYWNAVRFSTASIDLKMDTIISNMNVGDSKNPMVDQLKLILSESVAIKDALSSIIYSNSTSANAGGTGIKVYLG